MVTGVFFLKNTNQSGGADIAFGYGPGGPGLLPLMGDYDGDGVDTVGLYATLERLLLLKEHKRRRCGRPDVRVRTSSYFRSARR